MVDRESKRKVSTFGMQVVHITNAYNNLIFCKNNLLLFTLKCVHIVYLRNGPYTSYFCLFGGSFYCSLSVAEPTTQEKQEEGGCNYW